MCEFLASVARLYVCLPVCATLLSCPLRVRLVKRIPRLDINSLRHRAPVSANVTIPISRNNGLSAVTFIGHGLKINTGLTAGCVCESWIHSFIYTPPPFWQCNLSLLSLLLTHLERYWSFCASLASNDNNLHLHTYRQTVFVNPPFSAQGTFQRIVPLKTQHWFFENLRLLPSLD